MSPLTGSRHSANDAGPIRRRDGDKLSKGKRVAVIYYFETLPTRCASANPRRLGHDRMCSKLWHAQRNHLKFLKRAPKRYSELTFHRVAIPAGKAAHRTPELKALIVEAGKKAHFKESGPGLKARGA